MYLSPFNFISKLAYINALNLRVLLASPELVPSPRFLYTYLLYVYVDAGCRVSVCVCALVVLLLLLFAARLKYR